MADSNLPIVNALEELKTDNAKQRKALQDSLGRRFRILSGEVQGLGTVLANSFQVQSESAQFNSEVLTRLANASEGQSELSKEQLAFQQAQAQELEFRDAENRRELARIADGSQQEPPQPPNNNEDEKKSKGIFGKLLSGIGGIIGGAGLGAGALLAGAGILVAGGGYFLDKLNEMDGAAIKENVMELLSIKDEFNGMGNFFLEGGAFGLAMAGIGTGLAFLGAGSAIAGLGSALANFTNPNWAQSIVDNVTTLLTIGDVAADGSLALLADGAAFTMAMTGIGIGLGIFGLGASIAGLSDALTNFTSAGWAQSIVDNVATLLSISELPQVQNAGFLGTGFAGIMTEVAAGLAVFGVGAGIAGLGSALTNFADPTWADAIVTNVATLLTIADMSTADAGDFTVTMTAIAAGLGVFGVGTALVGIGKFASGDGFAQNIKNEVSTLLGILDDENVSAEKASEFNTVLTRIGGALGKFGAGSFVDALGRAGAAVLDFFSGSESPITSVMKLADRKTDLEVVATSLEKISKSLDSFGQLTFDASQFEIEQFADNLEDAVNDLDDLDEDSYQKFLDKLVNLRKTILGGDTPNIDFSNIEGAGIGEIQPIPVRLVGAEVDLRSRAVDAERSNQSVNVTAPQTSVDNSSKTNVNNNNVVPASPRRSAPSEQMSDFRDPLWVG